MNQIEPSEVALFVSHRRKPCDEQLLTLQSQGITARVMQGPQGWMLLVHPDVAPTARVQLEAYGKENIGWPPQQAPPPILSQGRVGAFLYALIIVCFHPIGRSGLAGMNWLEAGKVDAGAILDGEWWRTFTALTLHADASHLAGNLVFGAAFAVLASHLLGSGLTWFCVVLAGGLGNLLNSVVHIELQHEAHTSIGASTAVFGCLGLMASYEWLRRSTLQLQPMRRFAPLLGGAALLGFLGTSGANTDVGAHLAGALAGGFLGFIVGKLRLPEELSEGAQAILGLVAVLIIAGAWTVGLRSF